MFYSRSAGQGVGVVLRNDGHVMLTSPKCPVSGSLL